VTTLTVGSKCPKCQLRPNCGPTVDLGRAAPLGLRPHLSVPGLSRVSQARSGRSSEDALAAKKKAQKAPTYPRYRASDDPDFGALRAQPCPSCKALVIVRMTQGLPLFCSPVRIPLNLEPGVVMAGLRTFSLKKFGPLAFITWRLPTWVGVTDNGFPILAEHRCREVAP
jgi:hypothetical protein